MLREQLRKNPILKKIYIKVVRMPHSLKKKTEVLKFELFHRAAFKDIYATFEKEKVRYCIAYGTLLGIVREGKLLKRDMDIDMIVFAENDDEIERIREVLKRNRYKHLFAFIVNELGVNQDAYQKYGIRIDIGYVREDPEEKIDHLYVLYGDNNENVIMFSFSHIKKMKTIDFEGAPILIPDNPERFLAEVYGEEWRIPDPNYVYWDNPHITHTDYTGRAIQYTE